MAVIAGLSAIILLGTLNRYQFMIIWVNGEQISWQPSPIYQGEDFATLLHWLADHAFSPPFAVAINHQFIPKAQYAHTPLKEGDNLEIVKAVTGG